MQNDKRDAPGTAVTLPVEQFLILWITQLQMEITHQETDADPARFMVRGYDEANAIEGKEDDFTELDLYTDDPTNLVDGTWRDPQLWRDAEERGCITVGAPHQSLATVLQVDPTDAALCIERVGGRVIKFDVCGEDHYEVTLDGETYGPMVETELYWFACGVKLRTQTNKAKGTIR